MPTCDLRDRGILPLQLWIKQTSMGNGYNFGATIRDQELASNDCRCGVELLGQLSKNRIVGSFARSVTINAVGVT
jgi:hypothetical protein